MLAACVAWVGRLGPAQHTTLLYRCPRCTVVLLQRLELGQYAAGFDRQEVDLTIVHALTSDDLASLGVTDRLHQVRVM